MTEQREKFTHRESDENIRKPAKSETTISDVFRQSRQRVDAVNKFSEKSKSTWIKFEEIDSFIEQNRNNLEKQQFFQSFQKALTEEKERFEVIWNEVDDAEAEGGLAGGLTILPLNRKISEIEALRENLETRLTVLTEFQEGQTSISSIKKYKGENQEIITALEQHPKVKEFLTSLQQANHNLTETQQALAKSDLDPQALSEQAQSLQETNRQLSEIHKKTELFLAIQLKLEQKASEKLVDIRNTRPENIDEYNAQCKKEYHERYYTGVYQSEDEQGKVMKDSWDIYTSIHKKDAYACYQAKLIFEEGSIENVTFREQYSYKRRPIYDQYSEEYFPYGNGQFDEEVTYGETQPLKHDIIMFNMIESTLDEIENQKLLPGDRAKFASKQLKIESEDAIDPKAIEVLNTFTYEDNQEVTYPPENLGFKAMAKVNTGWGKFYLAEHHYTNKEIKLIKLERKLPSNDKTDEDDIRIRYHSTFIIQNKNQNF